jgi:hypothetical protein
MTRLAIATFLVLNTYFLRAQGQDAALWAGMEFDKTIVKKVTAHVKFQGRLNENFTHADYGFIDIGLSYKLNDYVRFTSAYVMNSKNSALGNNWRLRQQWYGNARFAYKWNNFSISNRNQLQTDLEDSRSSAGSWFYRNKTVVKYKLKDSWQPYFSYEMYFRLGFRPLHEGLIYRKRYSFGVEYSFSKNTSLQMGYLIQTQLKRKQPDEIYALTLGFNHSFPGKLIDPKRKKKVKYRKY